MSYMRAQRREISRNVMYDNRLTVFTNPPIHTGDLYVERNQSIGGNLDICGNLTIGGDMRARNYYATGNYYLNNYVLIPAGTIIQSAAINEPEGWFDCNGRTLLKVNYNGLFIAIGHTYGGYSGVDLSFNIPDMRGRVGIGSGEGSGLLPRLLGVSGGAETHTLTVGEMPSHSHSSNAVGNSIGLITADGTNTAINGDSSSTEPNIFTRPVALTIDISGGGSAHNNMQPYVVLRYLIKY